MAVSIRFAGAADGEDGPFELCSASEWSEFALWAEAQDEFPLLRELVGGAALDTEALAAEIATAPPRPFFGRLIALVGVGDEDETLTVEM